VSTPPLLRLLYLFLAVLTVATIAAGIVFFVRQRGGKLESGGPASKYVVSNRPLFTTTENRRKVTLFFPRSEGFLLVPQEREIYATRAVSNQMKQVIVELIKGPGEDAAAMPALPDSTRLREIYLRGRIVYVDLTKDVTENLPGGSEAELLTVYAIVDSIAFNFPEITGVKILVEGAQVETLSGHIDMSLPLAKDLSYVRTIPPKSDAS